MAPERDEQTPETVDEPTADAGGEDEDVAAAELDALRAQADEYREHLQRLQAEFDNYRKRVLKEQTDAVERAAGAVVGVAPDHRIEVREHRRGDSVH